MFYLLDQPTEKEFETLANRYREMDPLAVKATVSLLKTGSDLLTGFETLLKRYGLSQGRFLILVVMNRKPDQETTPSELAGKVGVTRATMTGLIDGLEKDGLVRRIPHANDRRKLSVALTPAGKRRLEELLPDYWTRIHRLMDGLTGEEQAVLIRLLNRVSGRLPALTSKGEKENEDSPV